MSRETMAERLVAEAYDATHYDEAKFKPMDPRRAKRLAAIFENTSYNSTEVLNRIVGAMLCSAAYRRSRRT